MEVKDIQEGFNQELTETVPVEGENKMKRRQMKLVFKVIRCQ